MHKPGDILNCTGWHREDRMDKPETLWSWKWGTFDLLVHEVTPRGFQGVTDWGYRVHVWSDRDIKSGVDSFYPSPNPVLR